MVYVLYKLAYSYILLLLIVHLCFLQLIPGAGFHQRHLGFEWGPGDLLVYETNCKLQGITNIHTGFWKECVWKRHHKNCQWCVCVHAQVQVQRALRSSTSWGKMKTSALPSCVSSSTSPISSSWGCRKSKRTSRAKTRRRSESSKRGTQSVSWCVFVICHCFLQVREHQ